MIISVIQGRPVYKYKDSFYDFNLVDYEKYLKQCDHLIYLASVETISEARSKDLLEIDSKRITIEEIKRDTLLDYICLNKDTKRVIIKAIDSADLVVVKMPSITIGTWSAKYLRNLHKPYFIEVIGCAWDSFWYHSFKGKLLAPFNYLLTKQSISKAEHVIYVTNEFLQRRYPNSCHNIGCSNVVLPEIKEEVLESRLKKISNKKDCERIKLGTAGAIYVKSKGQSYVIKAISLLKQKGIIVDYYLAGGGSKDYLERKAKKFGVLDQVHFMGVVPKSEMYDFYDMIDIYVHPSLAEGLPRVLIEAESRGVPAIGANAAGTPELLTNDCVFPKKDATSISRLIMNFTKTKMRDQATINYNRAKNYSYETLNERRRIFYDKVLK